MKATPCLNRGHPEDSTPPRGSGTPCAAQNDETDPSRGRERAVRLEAVQTLPAESLPNRDESRLDAELDQAGSVTAQCSLPFSMCSSFSDQVWDVACMPLFNGTKYCFPCVFLRTAITPPQDSAGSGNKYIGERPSVMLRYHCSQNTSPAKLCQVDQQAYRGETLRAMWWYRRESRLCVVRVDFFLQLLFGNTGVHVLCVSGARCRHGAPRDWSAG